MKDDPRFPVVEPRTKRVQVDFDGVLAERTWPSPHLGEPIREGLDCLSYYMWQGFEVVIFTARPPSHFERMWDWLHLHQAHWFVYDITNQKLPSDLYIDDRCWVPTWVK